jgi:hypothetical protein
MVDLKAFSKYLLSFFKTNWTLEDYPVRFRHFRVDESGARRRLTPVPWMARVINWPLMFGHGQTKEEAYADLKRHFEEYKGQSKTLPRPGTRVRPEIELAPTVEIEPYEPLAGEFFEKVLAMNYGECLVTDESSLWDFHGEETNEEYHRKIVEVYGVDVSDIESGNLVQIFKRISAQERPA